MIKRLIHVFCDKCGAEGPSRVGEQRPQLLQEIFQLGWEIVNGQHWCMECVKPKLHVHVPSVFVHDDRTPPRDSNLPAMPIISGTPATYNPEKLA